MFRVVALDPGGTTGWASYSAEKLENPLTEEFEYVNEDFRCGQIEIKDHHHQLYGFLGFNHTNEFYIVCERFEYRNTSRAGLVLDSREYIGVVKLFVQERNYHSDNAVTLSFQNASEAKGFVRDSHIKKLGLWSPGNPHAMDATRHLLYWLTTQYEDKKFRKALLEKGWK